MNLAPSDVLEALNRLLDDNRELFIPETQETVKPHPDFLLFATQNPPGLYGGRKVLSRAFRNRFLELHFDDIPEDELSVILEKRCIIPPTYAKKIVEVFKALQNSRSKSRIFDGKHGYVTLRDLFRWSNRRAAGNQALAEDGYMILADKIRAPEDKKLIIDILEKTFRIKLDIDEMYNSVFEKFRQDVISFHFNDSTSDISKFLNEVVWTKSMKRLFALVLKCIQNNEPVLLVGDTGCGKTSVCQVLSEYLGRKLHILNAHQNSEVSDFIGSQRPVRGKDIIEQDIRSLSMKFIAEFIPSISFDDIPDISCLISLVDDCDCIDELAVSRKLVISELFKRYSSVFEWCDGPLIEAMKHGDIFLLDEISLADDSVLERLNSVLEPHRLLVLAEKANSDQSVIEIFGKEGFEFMATMNPGGDYGKKELSPALRNRFTEIWAPQVSDRDDLLAIINSKFSSKSLMEWNVAEKIMCFVEWFADLIRKPSNSVFSLRDILAWAVFISSTSSEIKIQDSFYHGGCLILVDSIGINPLFGVSSDPQSIQQLRSKCQSKLCGIAEIELVFDLKIVTLASSFGIDPFYIPHGPYKPETIRFSLQAPTTVQNCMRVLRAMQLKKPILLEGSPGVGKTSLISNLALLTGRRLVRINLSEQTDLSDLFGADLPVEEDVLKSRNGPEFAWRDGPFLQAMKSGDWVLLDELNLASQQVLEGLNSCMDHRGIVFIPELNMEFKCSSEFRIFAAQNPQNQGGGRKGLPKSFVNRFTQVFIDALSQTDLLFIVRSLHPDIQLEVAEKMITFVSRINSDISSGSFGRSGAPWEFNLRDVLRWVELSESYLKSNNFIVVDENIAARFLNIIFIQRMRCDEDRNHISSVFKEIFGDKMNITMKTISSITVSSQYLTVGSSSLIRNQSKSVIIQPSSHILLQNSSDILESLIQCVNMNSLVLLTGSSSSGKTSLIRLLSKFAGYKLEEFSMNSGVDTIELLGGFEQVDLVRRQEKILELLEEISTIYVRCYLSNGSSLDYSSVNHLMSEFSSLNSSDIDFSVRVSLFIDRLDVTLGTDYSSKISHVRLLIDQFATLHSRGLNGCFEWIDGVLIKALEEGHWVLIDNVNFCSPSVLDRLNSLFEPNGSLMINERGLVDGKLRVIRPHENFRIFLTMDPKHGEISRAMRNRAVELSMFQSECLVGNSIQDVRNILGSIGIFSSVIADSLGKIHKFAFAWISDIKQLGLVESEPDTLCLIRFARLYLERVQRGENLKGLVLNCLEEIYMIDINLELVEIPENLLISATSSRYSLKRAISELDNIQHDISVAFNETYNTALNVLATPASWPLSVSGDMCALNSRLSRTISVGCLVENIFFNFTDENSIKSRSKDLIKNVNEIDLTLMNLMLFYRKASNSSSTFVFNELISFIQDLHSGRTKSISLDESLLEVSYQLRSFDFNRAAYFSKCSLLQVSELSLIQRSFLFHFGSINKAQLLHESNRLYFPLFECLSKALNIWINNFAEGNTSFFMAIFSRLQEFWNLVIQQSPEYSHLEMVIRRTKKCIKSSKIVESFYHAKESNTLELVDLISKLEMDLNLSSASFLGSLWKSSGIVTLRKSELFNLQESFAKADTVFIFEGRVLKDWIISCLSRKESEVMAIMEGYSSVYLLNENSIENSELLNVLSKVPIVIFILI